MLCDRLYKRVCKALITMFDCEKQFRQVSVLSEVSKYPVTDKLQGYTGGTECKKTVGVRQR